MPTAKARLDLSVSITSNSSSFNLMARAAKFKDARTLREPNPVSAKFIMPQAMAVQSALSTNSSEVNVSANCWGCEKISDN